MDTFGESPFFGKNFRGHFSGEFSLTSLANLRGHFFNSNEKSYTLIKLNPNVVHEKSPSHFLSAKMTADHLLQLFIVLRIYLTLDVVRLHIRIESRSIMQSNILTVLYPALGCCIIYMHY